MSITQKYYKKAGRNIWSRGIFLGFGDANETCIVSEELEFRRV